MKRYVTVLLISLAASIHAAENGGVVSSARRPGNARPNVLLIISDDQGYGEFGFTGNKNVLTPNLDKLAEQSAVFGNFVVAPACSPTRSALMMGRNHFKTGVWGVGPACNILDDEVFMPQFFKKIGYATALFGKGDSVQAVGGNPDGRYVPNRLPSIRTA
ncbi:MAG: sulfatase-like hydrolase/transferase [Lentisphaerae bacterium]|nr:sulfatase-like hydrolase/transferase [Lentisphaerota bacterium]MBT5606696.1 sulfatase-like hydrolase/transferase [Lentisphaerota bacterium]MBT7061367.1 sulfatase-like hydrolase/transferase [Lentisphaerota bacterium]MBT7844260.1 sulfatase-like hydrolase/transferase [Lentisphaerota bacterium]